MYQSGTIYGSAHGNQGIGLSGTEIDSKKNNAILIAAFPTTFNISKI